MWCAWRIATAGSDVFVGLGTNVGDRRSNLVTAVSHLARLFDISALSSIYETEPVGFADQEPFWNMIVRGRTGSAPSSLLAQLIALERAMGRERTFRNAPRIIDLDVLLYDDVKLDDASITIPHPRMTERAFVLKPLVELAPALTHPITGQRFSDILQRGTFERALIVEPPIGTW